MDLYKNYLDMIAEAESFMKVHKVRMSGEDIKSGTVALVIPQSLLNEFAEKIKKVDIAERRKKDLLEEKQNWKKEAEKEKMINYTLDRLRGAGNPYNVPEQSSSSDDAAFYFPFGRD